MGSITVPDHTLQRQKKPSVTHVSVNYDLPFRCHGNLSELLGKSGARQGTPWKGFWLERLPVTQEAAGSSPVAPANFTYNRSSGTGISAIGRSPNWEARSPSLNRAGWRAAPASCACATDRTTPLRCCRGTQLIATRRSPARAQWRG